MYLNKIYAKEKKQKNRKKQLTKTSDENNALHPPFLKHKEQEL
jgi:hypothetical protein